MAHLTAHILKKQLFYGKPAKAVMCSDQKVAKNPWQSQHKQMPAVIPTFCLATFRNLNFSLFLGSNFEFSSPTSRGDSCRVPSMRQQSYSPLIVMYSHNTMSPFNVISENIYVSVHISNSEESLFCQIHSKLTVLTHASISVGKTLGHTNILDLT